MIKMLAPWTARAALACYGLSLCFCPGQPHLASTHSTNPSMIQTKDVSEKTCYAFPPALSSLLQGRLRQEMSSCHQARTDVVQDKSHDRRASFFSGNTLSVRAVCTSIFGEWEVIASCSSSKGQNHDSLIFGRRVLHAQTVVRAQIYTKT